MKNKNGYIFKDEKAITLVALVITIIILLILAGITISAITNIGILSKAKKATQNYDEMQEKEMIQTELYSSYINKNANNGDSFNIGEQLYDKSVENGSKWHIIVMNESKKIYGTGWTFIPKGTVINNRETQENWLINSYNQDLIKLEDDSFTELSYSSAVGVTEGLIFNLDPSVIENATKDNINEQLGENVELVNFNWNDDIGLSNKAFNFDGVDDYIKIKYDNEEEKDKLAKNGLTFEFYGILNGGTSYDEKNQVINTNYKGIFCYWSGNESKQANLRFGMMKNKNIFWNPGTFSNKDGVTEKHDYSDEAATWNIIYPETQQIEIGKEIYFTISVDCTQETYKHTLYANGNKLYDGKLSKAYWDLFVKRQLNPLKYFCIGRSSMNKNGYWHYSKMNAYSIKMYNRGLSEQEVKENYNKAVAYHNTL